MILLTMSDPVNVPGDDLELVHISTTWELSDVSDFSNILWDSIENEIDKTTITVNMYAENDVVYYARCRYIYEQGLSKWSNVDTVMKHETINSLFIPTIVTIPEIDTSFNSNELPFTQFEISIINNLFLSNVDHIATTWLIEDKDGCVVFLSREDEDNLLTIKIRDFLKLNTVYIIKTKIHTSSGDDSEFGSKIVYTSNDRKHEVLFSGNNYFRIPKNGFISFERIDEYLKLEVTIFKNFNYVDNIIITDEELDLITLDLNVGESYLFKTKVVKNDNTTNESSYYLIQIDESVGNTGSNLPYHLTGPDDETQYNLPYELS